MVLLRWDLEDEEGEALGLLSRRGRPRLRRGRLGVVERVGEGGEVGDSCLMLSGRGGEMVGE